MLMGEDMKKVAIVTIESMNYGNRLQNYALQILLQSIGCEVETFHRETIDNSIKEKIKRLMQSVLKTKALKFRQFDRNIKFSRTVIERDIYPVELSCQYDYFVVGSDQVWNPYYDFVAGKSDFLCFANNSQKISYAASFGVSEIPSTRRTEYGKYLNEFKAISVREKQGKEIVKKLARRDAMVVLDPTLMLTANDWKKVERKSKWKPKNKYIFVYSLGEKNERFKKKIEQLSLKYEVFDIRTIQRSGKELSIGPSEFLYLVRNSEMVLTDSFHATVFSVIFHKRFITFNRNGLNMNSRIESLAELLNEKNHINEYGDFDCEDMIDYEIVDRLLKEEQKKSINFLNRALED